MHKYLRRGVITAAAATGLLAASTSYSMADSTAEGLAVGSPGLLSGNNVQAPVHVPVNVCGNTVNVVGLLNPVFGNACANNDTPTPQVPTPQVPTPQVPTPQVPTPQVPTPQVPQVPQVPTPQVPTPQVPQVPQVPEVPTPQVPQVPQVPEVPTPQVPEVPTPDVPTLEVPEVPTPQVATANVNPAELAQTGSSLLPATGVAAGLLLSGALLYRRRASHHRAR